MTVRTTAKPFLPANLGQEFDDLDSRAPRIYTASSGGAAWTDAVAGWIEPQLVPEWSQCRVTNTDVGNQLWLATTDETGERFWNLVA